MKKFVGAICSGAAGLLTFVWLCLPWLTQKITMGDLSEKVTFSGWNLITNRYEGQKAGFETFKGAYTLHRVFAIIALIAACLLVAYAVVLLLKRLNVLKFNFKFNLVNNILLTVLAGAVLVAVVGVVVMAAAALKELGNPDYLSIYASVGAWLSLVVAAAACVCGWVLARKEN